MPLRRNALMPAQMPARMNIKDAMGTKKTAKTVATAPPDSSYRNFSGSSAAAASLMEMVICRKVLLTVKIPFPAWDHT